MKMIHPGSIGTAVVASAVLFLGPGVGAAGATTASMSDSSPITTGASKGIITITSAPKSVKNHHLFRVKGNFRNGKIHLKHHIVSVQTKTHDKWHGLSGARTHTNKNGHFSARVNLFAKGKRHLRIVGQARKGGPYAASPTMTITVK